MMYQLGWFSTGRDKAARDLLEVVCRSIAQGEIKAEPAFVFCNREAGESEESDLFIKQVKDYSIPLITFSYKKFKAKISAPAKDESDILPSWRLTYDREVIKRLRGFKPDLSVLAGYMLIIGKEMCSKYNMINLHPAAPGGPTGTWQEVIWQLIESNSQETGVMMHLVTPELDRGPAVSYCTFSIKGEPFDKYWQELRGKPVEEIKKTQGENNPLFKLIREHGLIREFPLIVSTIKAFTQGKVKISKDKKIIDATERQIRGYNLTKEIDELVKGTLK